MKITLKLEEDLVIKLLEVGSADDAFQQSFVFKS